MYYFVNIVRYCITLIVLLDSTKIIFVGPILLDMLTHEFSNNLYK